MGEGQGAPKEEVQDGQVSEHENVFKHYKFINDFIILLLFQLQTNLPNPNYSATMQSIKFYNPNAPDCISPCSLPQTVCLKTLTLSTTNSQPTILSSSLSRTDNSCTYLTHPPLHLSSGRYIYHTIIPNLSQGVWGPFFKI